MEKITEITDDYYLDRIEEIRVEFENGNCSILTNINNCSFNNEVLTSGCNEFNLSFNTRVFSYLINKNFYSGERINNISIFYSVFNKNKPEVGSMYTIINYDNVNAIIDNICVNDIISITIRGHINA